MANQEHLDILAQEIEAWNQWREQHPEVKIDFSKAIFRGTNLAEPILTKLTLRKPPSLEPTSRR